MRAAVAMPGWTNPDEMLANPAIDIVYISVPTGLHSKFGTRALVAGKHVWCEKPLTCDFPSTNKLVRLAEEKGQVLAEAFMYLYHPQFRRVKAFVNNEKSGKIHTLTCKFGIPVLSDPGFRNDRSMGGGAMLDVGTYTVSAALALFPGQEVKLLFAEVRSYGRPVDVDGRAILRFSSGTTAYLEWGCGLSYRNEIDLWTERGSLFTDKIFSKPNGYQPSYRFRDYKGCEYLESSEPTNQFVEMFKGFKKMLHDPKRAADESKRILESARLVDEITRYSEAPQDLR